VPHYPNPLPYMSQSSRPLAPLLRWLESLEYNAVRRIETPSLFTTCVRDDGRPMRGVLLMDDLCMTRQKTFYALSDDRTRAVPVSHAVVSKAYRLQELQDRYKALQDEWKVAHATN
jgi:hypothetical protein